MIENFPTNSEAFQGASDALKDMMASLAVETHLEKGEVLFEYGDIGDTFYAVLSGTLEFSVIASDGRKLSLDVMHEGALFGEISLFDPGPRTATVTALKPTRIQGIRNADFLQALERTPELAIEMLQLAGRRMRWMSYQLTVQVFLPLPPRLARKLLHLCDHLDDRQPVLKHSQAELAEFIGASREAVSKTLSQWNKDKIVALSRGGLKLLDKDALTEISEITNI
ncbi:Crp/Fnr family transcriptional regulator [Sulfitobacter aestuariivivens]|uniref:Crp/Fnr family transcriptional regulator n=1 Tax=Sulfitobacter aestuariivivens TaxID=2766981 RepID=A0A927D716_9RHOB|nr:Crp/Fnr family transcriptional regulator [Sulfitobacter aestuariivivens]MBD3664979.1 Crp/Fnr family transcriptional regulator [Sulfitobacter aestuariivivens]